jgi:hypothetical protein
MGYGPFFATVDGSAVGVALLENAASVSKATPVPPVQKRPSFVNWLNINRLAIALSCSDRQDLQPAAQKQCAPTRFLELFLSGSQLNHCH